MSYKYHSNEYKKIRYKPHKNNKTLKKCRGENNKTKNNKTKKCFTNLEISKICKSGKYTSFDDNSIFSEEYLRDLSKKPDYIKDPVKYRDYIIEEFKKVSSKDLNYETKLTKNDFYSFINNEWITKKDNEHNLKYYVEVDNFRIVQEKVYYKLIDYVIKYINENPHSKKARAIKNVYESIKNNTITTLRKHTFRQLNEVNGFIENNDMYGLLADINKEEILSWGAPIKWSLLPDEKNVKKYISHLSTPELSIYDYMIYINDSQDTKEIKKYKKFVKDNFMIYIDKVFTACTGNKNHGYNPLDVWDVEYDILVAMGCESFKKDDPNSYNVVYANEMEPKFGFDWKHFTKLLGYKTPPKKIIVSSINALKCLTELLKKNWNTPKWKTYWLYIQYRQIIRFEPSLTIHFDFYKKILEGTPEIMPSKIYPIFILSLTFNTFLSEEYRKHNENHLYKNYVKYLVHELRYLFIRKLERNTWLSSKTKASAIHKLKKLEIVVGEPCELREDPILNYKNDDPWYNVRLITKWKHEKYVKLEGKPIIDIPDIDWNNFKLIGTQNYMVNAYYRPTSNSIYVPLAYLQPPFIDLRQRGLEYNLAFIGYTIGHELSHSLDDMGSNYDADGNLNNWWSDEDRKKFKHKIRDVVNQYELYAKRDGITLDAEIGVGEDLADINGISLVEEYLLEFNKSKNIFNRINKISFEGFYIYLAIQGRQMIYKKALKSQLKMNPHPLEKYRCNCPLGRLEIFKTIFNIKKGDNMWWHNNDTIW